MRVFRASLSRFGVTLKQTNINLAFLGQSRHRINFTRGGEVVIHWNNNMLPLIDHLIFSAENTILCCGQPGTILLSPSGNPGFQLISDTGRDINSYLHKPMRWLTLNKLTAFEGFTAYNLVPVASIWPYTYAYQSSLLSSMSQLGALVALVFALQETYLTIF